MIEAGDDAVELCERTPDPLRSGKRTGPLAKLVSMRVVVLFGFMRRSGTRARRRLFDISQTEWRIISQLGPFSPLSLNGLSELLCKDPGQLSRAVKVLVERGIVTRKRKPNGPEIELGLSEEGRVLFDEMIELAIKREQLLTKGIDPADLEATLRVIDKMIEHAEDLIEDNGETDK